MVGLSGWRLRHTQRGRGPGLALATALVVLALVVVTGPRSGPPPAAGAPATNGSVVAWGYNAEGTLGNGNTTNSSTAVLVSGLTGVTAVSASSPGLNTMALRFDGTVRAWGPNSAGQLGNGTTIASRVPVTVLQTTLPSPVPLSGVTAIAAGNSHSLALKSDGTVWAWGDNSFGQLGNTPSGLPVGSPLPVQVLTGPGTALTGITAISAGNVHSLALKSDGTVWAWGYNSTGELGDTTTTNRAVAVQVQKLGGGSLTGIVGIAAVGVHSLAIVGGAGGPSTNTAVAWGNNHFGQLGNGATGGNSTVAVSVTGLTGVTQVTGGGNFSLAVTSDGQAWSWGCNDSGQLGNNTVGSPANDSNVPGKVHGFGNVGFLTSVSKLVGGGLHSLALRTDGSVVAWGLNEFGQLGNGTTTNSNVPVGVLNVGGALDIAGGLEYSLAISPEVPLSTATPQPTATPVTFPTPLATSTPYIYQPPPTSAGNFFLISPVRVVDTRATAPGIAHTGLDPTGAPIPVAPLQPGVTQRFLIAGQTFSGAAFPAGTKGVQLNVTVVPTAGFGGFLTIFPGSVPDNGRPLTSTLNPSGPIISNLWSTPLGSAGSVVNGQPAAGTFAAYTQTVPLDLIVDVTGYYQ